MSVVGPWLRGIAYAIGFLGSAILGATVVLNVAGQLELDTLAVALRGALGAVALMVAVYFLVRVAETARSQAPIRTMGSGGPISVSPQAVRLMVDEVLAETFDIDDARVRIQSSREGLRIALRFSLPPDQRVPEIGERIQADVRSRIEDRVGVTVDEVDVTAQAFKSTSPAGATEASEAGRQPTDLPEERDRVD